MCCYIVIFISKSIFFYGYIIWSNLDVSCYSIFISFFFYIFSWFSIVIRFYLFVFSFYYIFISFFFYVFSSYICPCCFNYWNFSIFYVFNLFNLKIKSCLKFNTMITFTPFLFIFLFRHIYSTKI